MISYKVARKILVRALVAPYLVYSCLVKVILPVLQVSVGLQADTSDVDDTAWSILLFFGVHNRDFGDPFQY